MAPRSSGNGNGKAGIQGGSTSKHPSVVEMEATLERIGKQLTLDDWLQQQLDRLRSEQSRNAALQAAFCGLDVEGIGEPYEEPE